VLALQIDVEETVYTLHLPPNPDGPRPTWLLSDEDRFMHLLREHPQYISCSGPAGARYELTFNSRKPAPDGWGDPQFIKGFIAAATYATGFVEIYT
jgi:hypothetical protein